LIESDKKNKKEIRVWMDGVFDMMHFGHMNAFRQARSLGTYLVAGVCSDETTTACKGKPICSERERIDTVRGCKWVDEVVPNSPYVMNDEYLHYIIDKYKIDYIVHGDDPCIIDGKDAYESAIKLGKYLTIPRTEGVSTTDIVGRMLLMTTSHHVKNDSIDEHDDEDVSIASQQTSTKKLVRSIEEDSPHYFDRKSNFLTTSRIIRLFGAGVKAPKPSDRVVYVAGAWDMFHAGHIETLEKAKE
jgi:ethanolamine-phosphate cytidylyltransferase